MIPLTSTQNKPIEFIPSQGKEFEMVRMSTPKIGWLHTLADTPGAKFDLTIKDIHGQVKLHKKDCGNDTAQYGELINMPAMLGEQLKVEISNLKGAKKVQVFLN